MSLVKITEKDITNSVSEDSYILITQKETVDDTEVECLRRAPLEDVLSMSGGGVGNSGSGEQAEYFNCNTADSASGNYSHAEGYSTTASGTYSHAEGNSSKATGDYSSHAEGFRTTASGSYGAHAEGSNTTASDNYAHAEGFVTTASYTAAHAEGYQTQAIDTAAHSEGYGTLADYQAHAEGYGTKAYGTASHTEGSTTTAGAEGTSTKAYGYYSHAEGGYSTTGESGSTSKGSYAHAEGYYSTASGNYTHAEGADTKASGTSSHAEGFYSTASGYYAHAEGNSTTASGDYGAHAEGQSTTASGHYSHAEGTGSIASGDSAHAEGASTTASAGGAHSEGCQTQATGVYAHAGGYYTTAGAYQTAIGEFNDNTSEGMTELTGGSDTSGSLFMVGNGTSTDTLSNAFRVAADGTCYAGNSFEGSGADFAEFFEWLDGNTDNEDRRGLFVTLDGEKIRTANADDDYILGVVSAVPTVMGDAKSEVWKDMYLTDAFGERLTETVTVEEYTEESTYTTIKGWTETVITYETNEETGEVTEKTETVEHPEEVIEHKGATIPEHTEVRFILNPDYDSSAEYVSRDKRQEWAAIGIVGKIVVCDDGTCEVNGYCKCADGGKATAAESGYKVMSRIDDEHVKILIK